MNTQKKTLVIGGAGFIGSHLTTQLHARGIPVRVLGRRPDVGVTEWEYLAGDFCDRATLHAALRDVDVVYHLAVTTVPGDANSRILYDANTNLMGTLQLIEMAADAGVRRFIFVSSGGTVYGPVTDNRPISEQHPTNPISAHAISKLAVEKYLEVYRRHTGMEYRIARGGNPYGEGQALHKRQGFVGTALDRIARNEEVVVWGDGSVVRDFFYVGDFAAALLAMRDDDALPRLYNIGSGEGYSLRQVIGLMEQVIGRKINVRYESGRIVDLPWNVLDVSRSREHLGWRAQTSLRTGLARTWAHIARSMELLPLPSTVSIESVPSTAITSD